MSGHSMRERDQALEDSLQRWGQGVCGSPLNASVPKFHCTASSESKSFHFGFLLALSQRWLLLVKFTSTLSEAAQEQITECRSPQKISPTEISSFFALEIFVHHPSFLVKYNQQEHKSCYCIKNNSSFPHPRKGGEMKWSNYKQQSIEEGPITSRTLQDSRQCHKLSSYLTDRIPRERREHRNAKNTPKKPRSFNQPQPAPQVAQRAPETQLHCAVAGAAPCGPRHGEDELGRLQSNPTSWEGDRQFCPEVITTARGGAASTSCATGKNASYPHILHLASHGKGTARSDAKKSSNLLTD